MINCLTCRRKTFSHFTQPYLQNDWLGVKSDILRQDPLEAILVFFGRRALNFLFENSWKKEKWRHFCAHAQWWSPWRRKNVENGHLAPSNLTFLLIAIDTNGFRRMKDEGQIYKSCLGFFTFCLGIYDLSKFSDNFTPFFDFERP